eukprot:619911-Pleurochrysis_carterae.AAC.2
MQILRDGQQPPDETRGSSLVNGEIAPSGGFMHDPSERIVEKALPSYVSALRLVWQESDLWVGPLEHFNVGATIAGTDLRTASDSPEIGAGAGSVLIARVFRFNCVGGGAQESERNPASCGARSGKQVQTRAQNIGKCAWRDNVLSGLIGAGVEAGERGCRCDGDQKKRFQETARAPTPGAHTHEPEDDDLEVLREIVDVEDEGEQRQRRHCSVEDVAALLPARRDAKCTRPFSRGATAR